ncbi:MAG: hypothetical protein PHO80_04545 [Candidatus Gracilibacteria bacterium]|nr:hypothetical protein [Candidatus Gracilibacteria bacterium]
MIKKDNKKDNKKYYTEKEVKEHMRDFIRKTGKSLEEELKLKKKENSISYV